MTTAATCSVIVRFREIYRCGFIKIKALLNQSKTWEPSSLSWHSNVLRSLTQYRFPPRLSLLKWLQPVAVCWDTDSQISPEQTFHLPLRQFEGQLANKHPCGWRAIPRWQTGWEICGISSLAHTDTTSLVFVFISSFSRDKTFWAPPSFHVTAVN